MTGLVVFLVMLYILLLFTQTDQYKNLLQQYYTHKQKQAFLEPISKYHSDVFYWKEDDELTYKQTASSTGICRLITFSKNEIIAVDEHTRKKLLLPGKFVVENETAKFRLAARRAQSYHKNILPEIKKDLKQLKDFNENTDIPTEG